MVKYKTTRFHAMEEAKQSFSHEIIMARLLEAEGNYTKAAAYYRDASKKAFLENARTLAREFENLAREMEAKDKEQWIANNLGPDWYLVE